MPYWKPKINAPVDVEPAKDPSRPLPVAAVTNQCTAHNRRGERCRRSSLIGAKVCTTHGGSAPQVKRAAAVRLAMASDWLMAELLKIAKSGQDERTRLAAVNSALDRAGLGGKQQVQIEGTVELTAFEQRFDSIVRRGQARRESGQDDYPVVADDIIDAEVVPEAGDYIPISRSTPDGKVIDLPSRTPERIAYRAAAEAEFDAAQNQTANPPGPGRSHEDLYGDDAPDNPDRPGRRQSDVRWER